jgi:hypothetical protein
MQELRVVYIKKKYHFIFIVIAVLSSIAIYEVQQEYFSNNREKIRNYIKSHPESIKRLGSTHAVLFKKHGYQNGKWYLKYSLYGDKSNAIATVYYKIENENLIIVEAYLIFYMQNQRVQLYP